jgi:hypothetical protein
MIGYCSLVCFKSEAPLPQSGRTRKTISESHAIQAGLVSIILVVGLLCACKSEMTKIPPADVPIFRAKRLIAREYGPGGYKLTYSSTTEMEQVMEFYKQQMALFHWELTAGVEDQAKGRMFYYKKKRRLLNLHFIARDDGIGCRFIIAETGG